MKNITLAVEEGVLEAARVYAAEHKTTVNAMVRNYLSGLVQQKERGRRAMAELRKLSETTEARLGKDYRFDRESLYDG